MKTYRTARYICAQPCYIDPDSPTPENPYRLTIYSVKGGGMMLAADGNGAGGDIVLEDVDGWSDADINEQYRRIDLDAISGNADEFSDAGLEDEAEWLDAWADRVDKARSNTLNVCIDHLGSEATEDDVNRMVAALRAEGYYWAYHSDATHGDVSGITDAEWQRIMDKVFHQTA